MPNTPLPDARAFYAELREAEAANRVYDYLHEKFVDKLLTHINFVMYPVPRYITGIVLGTVTSTHRSEAPVIRFIFMDGQRTPWVELDDICVGVTKSRTPL